MTILSVLPILLIAIDLLLSVIPIRQKPGWLVFLPAAALVLFLLHILVDGFQAVLLGAYLFCLVLFLLNLRPMIRQIRLTQRTSMQQPVSHQPVRHQILSILGRVFWLVVLGLSLLPAVLLPFNYHSTPPSGAYAVGTVTYGWVDPARLETFTADPADHRKIAVQFWYPIDPGQSGEKAASAVENALLSTQKKQYPLVVFSHGAFGIRSSNTTTYMELASRGYIVASIDHTYHAFYTRFPDGISAIISQQFLAEIQRNQSGQMSEEEDIRTTFAWMDLRTADIRFTLDQIQALNAGKEPGSPLAGHIDEARIGLFGHSLGGAAAASVCRDDARCKAVAVIDSTMFGEYLRNTQARTLVTAPFPKPLMIFYNGDTYHATPDHQGYVPDVNAFNHAAAAAYSVVVNGAQHLNFTDLPARAPVLARLLGNVMTVNGGTAGTISQARCMEILDRYLVDFFNQNLLGEPSAMLSGPSSYPEVEFEVHQAK